MSITYPTSPITPKPTTPILNNRLGSPSALALVDNTSAAAASSADVLTDCPGGGVARATAFGPAAALVVVAFGREGGGRGGEEEGEGCELHFECGVVVGGKEMGGEVFEDGCDGEGHFIVFIYCKFVMSDTYM